jgi:hypothetical protein
MSHAEIQHSARAKEESREETELTAVASDTGSSRILA